MHCLAYSVEALAAAIIADFDCIFVIRASRTPNLNSYASVDFREKERAYQPFLRVRRCGAVTEHRDPFEALPSVRPKAVCR
jgi:hypothetical protein